MASYVQKGNGAATPVPEGAAPGFALVAVLVLDHHDHGTGADDADA